MDKKTIDNYTLEIMDYEAISGEGTVSEVRRKNKGLKDLVSHLLRLTLELSPVSGNNNLIIEYYPQGGTGSAKIPKLIRVHPAHRVLITRGSRNAKNLEFRYLHKCLCLKYQGYTIEIDF